jgi:hypothetical protein
MVKAKTIAELATQTARVARQAQAVVRIAHFERHEGATPDWAAALREEMRYLQALLTRCQLQLQAAESGQPVRHEIRGRDGQVVYWRDILDSPAGGRWAVLFHDCYFPDEYPGFFLHHLNGSVISGGNRLPISSASTMRRTGETFNTSTYNGTITAPDHPDQPAFEDLE